MSGGIIRLNPAEVKALSEKDLDYRKQLRSLRKEQNADKDRVETRLILANLFSVPLVLLAFGLALAIRRSSLRAAH